MKNYKISASKLEGKINPIPSKSTIHRSLIAALLSRSVTKLDNIVDSIDVQTTKKILIACGCIIIERENQLIVDARNLTKPQSINVEESGSSFRFIVPVLLYLFGECNITAKPGLSRRPHDLFLEIFKVSNIEYPNQTITFPLTVNGGIKPGHYKIAGNVSSQFISGLFFILPLLNDDSKIEFTTNLESKGYLDLTIDVLREFGIVIEECSFGYIIKGQQSYKQNIHYQNEVDESNIAFWRVANAINAEIKFITENENTSQPDAILSKILGENLDTVSVAECPDLLPILAVYGCSRVNGLTITGTERTKIKESNRLVAMATELKKIGANIKIDEKDNLIIKYSPQLKSGTVNSHNDHRIVMAMAISSLLISGELIIKDIEAINKSYPTFFTDFASLGGFFTLM